MMNNGGDYLCKLMIPVTGVAVLSVILFSHCTTNKKEITMQNTVQTHIALIKKTDKKFNSFITLDEKGAIAAAVAQDEDSSASALPLAGFTLAIKDNIEVAHLPTTGATKGLAHFIPKQDAPIVERLRTAGAIILGKTNLHELAFGITSNNYAYGAVGNAHRPDYFAGGSSGGTAVAIALGFVRAGVGTDTGGSSRIPAALNGVVGFRPTIGRYPQEGLIPLSHTRDTAGPMGHNVADVALLDAVMSGDMTDLSRLQARDVRLGVPHKYFYSDLSPAVQKVMDDVLRRLTDAGITLVEGDFEDDIGSLNEQMSFPIVLYETKHLLTQYLADRDIGLNLEQLHAQIESPDVKGVIGSLLEGGIPKEVYTHAINVLRPQLQKAYKDYFKRLRVDAFIVPTTPLPAQPIKGSDETVELNGKRVPTFLTFIRNMDPSSNAGVPGLTVPAGKSSDGLPIGVELQGPDQSDRHLLAIGALVESILER